MLDLRREKNILSIFLVQFLGLHLNSYREKSYRQLKAEVPILLIMGFLILKTRDIKTKRVKERDSLLASLRSCDYGTELWPSG